MTFLAVRAPLGVQASQAMTIYDLIHDPDVTINLAPEELAYHLLRVAKTIIQIGLVHECHHWGFVGGNRLELESPDAGAITQKTRMCYPGS